MSPVRLPELREVVPDDADLVVSGWGVTEDEENIVSNLRYVTVGVISNEDCSAIFGGNVITDSTLCASGYYASGPCNVLFC